MSEHADCPRVLRDKWEEAGRDVGNAPIDITISTEPPLVANPYSEGFTCPHGVHFWIEPTGEQLAKWASRA